jgi:hypothetical protein
MASARSLAGRHVVLVRGDSMQQFVGWLVFFGVVIDTPTFLCVKKRGGGSVNWGRNAQRLHGSPVFLLASAQLGALALRIGLLCDRSDDPWVGAATNP